MTALIFSDDTFTWEALELVGTVDASDLGLKPGEFPETFDVQSTTNADVLTFHQWIEQRDNEGEVLAMEYRALNKHRQLVYIFLAND